MGDRQTNKTLIMFVLDKQNLAPAKPDYIEHTIDELEVLDPDVVLPMHCSGSNFISAMQRRLPEKLITTNVGSLFTFAG